MIEQRMIKLLIVTCFVGIVIIEGAIGKKDKREASTTKIQPRYPEDSEPRRKELPIPADWSLKSGDAEFVGLLFAGKSEFNWIVDVRLMDQDQEQWSIGNLVTLIHVLTTCRAITNLAKHFNREEGKATLELLEAEMRVNFCTQFLWEEHKVDGELNPIMSSGTRLISSVTPHPQCTLDSFLYDFGVIELTKGINPYIPVIGYMPVYKQPSTGRIVNPRLNQMEFKKWVCYVASYGRDYRNINSTIVQDFKVKYRVYYADWKECEKQKQYICPEHIQGCNFSSVKPKNLRKLMCFKHRKKVGAICDHDRGAPLVCGSFVYGIVVRGAEFQYCHDLRPFPVIILKTYSFIEGFSYLIKYEHDEVVKDYGEEQRSANECTLVDRSHVISLAIMTLFSNLVVSV